MAIEVFNRHENKYMLDSDTAYSLQRRFLEYMEPDEYNKHCETYTITNLYYDTPDNHLIRTSLSKPKYKEKLRLRSYGVPSDDTKIYAEIKKKVGGLVNKRRSALFLDEAYEFLDNGELPYTLLYHNKQVLLEIMHILRLYELRPALYLAYDRKAYFGIGQHDLRISFDCNIRSRRYDLKLECGDYGDRLLDEGQCLMEVKSAQSIPIWLCRLLSEYKVYPTSFSKYGEVHMRSLEKTQPQRVYIFTPEKPALRQNTAVYVYEVI